MTSRIANLEVIPIYSPANSANDLMAPPIR